LQDEQRALELFSLPQKLLRASQTIAFAERLQNCYCSSERALLLTEPQRLETFPTRFLETKHEMRMMWSVNNELTYYPKFNEYRFGWMCGELALVDSLIVLPRVLYPQRPIAQMPRVLD
jgi:hypothetical protein